MKCSKWLWSSSHWICGEREWGNKLYWTAHWSHLLAPPTCPKGINTEGGMWMRLEMEDIPSGISLQ